MIRADDPASAATTDNASALLVVKGRRRKDAGCDVFATKLIVVTRHAADGDQVQSTITHQEGIW